MPKVKILRWCKNKVLAFYAEEVWFKNGGIRFEHFLSLSKTSKLCECVRTETPADIHFNFAVTQIIQNKIKSLVRLVHYNEIAEVQMGWAHRSHGTGEKALTSF
jgi:hypothetical protein